MAGVDATLRRFEQSRLDLYRRRGVDARTEWLVDRAGRRTAAVVAGEGERTTLLIHGVLSDASEWALVAGQLRDRRLVIPDWPGSGLSPPVDVRRTGVRAFAAQWLESVMAALGPGEVDIVGSSTGGYLALVYALANPARVRRLVQVGSLPGLARRTPLIYRFFATPGIGQVLLSQQPKDAEANRRQVYSKLVAHPERIPVDMLEADLAAMALPESVRSGVDFCRALVHPITGVRRSVLLADHLKTLQIPTLFLWGSDDNFLRPSAVVPVVRSAPCVTMEVVDGAGHLLTLERPDRVAQSVTAFL